MDIKQKIISLSQQAGACSIGFADIVEVSQHWKDTFDSMVSEGRHGSMAFMERNRDIRQNPALLLEGAKTLISLAFSYDKGVRNPRIASYALVPDYHYFLRQLLAPVISFLEQELGAQCRICVDSAPVAERFWALRTGVGVKLRNQQLMVPGVGSRVFLAEIITTAHIAPDPIVTYEGYSEVCIGCDRCVRACPNGALSDPERFDASRCVSYLTIEHRGELPQGLNLAGKIYGCDICLDACPYNRNNTNIVSDLLNSKVLHSTQKAEEGPFLHIRQQITNPAEGQITNPAEGQTTNPAEGQITNSAEGQITNAKEELSEQTTKECLSANFTENAQENALPTSQLSKEDSPKSYSDDALNPQRDRSMHGSDEGVRRLEEEVLKEKFYILQTSVDSPFEIDTDILSLNTQDIENMTSGQYKRLTKKSAMSRCPLSQLRRNL